MRWDGDFRIDYSSDFELPLNKYSSFYKYQSYAKLKFSIVEENTSTPKILNITYAEFLFLNTKIQGRFMNEQIPWHNKTSKFKNSYKIFSLNKFKKCA